MFVVFLCNYCIYSQNCEDGYTYYSELPDNVTNASTCFYNADLAAISELININSLTYESPLDVGNQTWLNNRLFNWVLTFTPSGSFGINQKLSQLPDNFSQLSALASLYIEKHDLIELPDSFTQLANVYNLYVSNNSRSLRLILYNNFLHHILHIQKYQKQLNYIHSPLVL